MSPPQRPRLAAGLRQQPGVRQQQRLALTPQVRQTIDMLPLPMMELQARIAQELVENPALEEDPEDEEVAEGEEAEPQEPSDEAEGGADDESRLPTDEEVATAPEKDAMSEIEERDFFADNYENTGGLGVSEEPPPLERTLPAGRTLAEHLREQLGLAVSNEAERAIGIHLIGNLDERGYLDGSVADLAHRLGADPAAVEAVRQRILRFDPTGCGASDLRECLLVQAETQEGDTALLRRIIADHLEQVMEERFREVAEATGAAPEQVMAEIRRIGELSFKPGDSFAASPEDPVVPDARAYFFNGEWRVELNESIPRLRANPAYREVQRSPAHTPEEQKFAREAWYRANGFRRSVEQRQETLRLVAGDIVKKQAAFLNGGIDRIAPLVLSDVANKIGRHESTVSRVVKNKYLQTPHGIIPFRRFFHSRLSNRDGQKKVSSEAVRQRIRQIVAREDPGYPLADDQIVQLLDREGIRIARRTIAKYRKAMRIPSSPDRRARHRSRLPGSGRRPADAD